MSKQEQISGRSPDEASVIADQIKSSVKDGLLGSMILNCLGTCSASDAEDLVGEVFVRFLDGLAAGDLSGLTAENCSQEEQLVLMRKWLFGIARNVRRESFRTRGNSHQTNFEAWATLPDRSSEPLIELGPDMNEVMTALDACPPKPRQVFLLTLDGWSYRDIAAQLEIKEGTARTHQHRARQHLQQLLEPLLY